MQKLVEQDLTGEAIVGRLYSSTAMVALARKPAELFGWMTRCPESTEP